MTHLTSLPSSFIQDLSSTSDIDLILISVCTPVQGDGRLDMTFIYSTLSTVSTLVSRNPKSTVVIRSTVSPGTCLKYKKALEDQVGREQTVCFQPEFLRAKSAFEDAMNPWYVVLGTFRGEATPAALYELYLDFVDSSKIEIMSVAEAELLKIFHNSFNAAKISFFNQCDLLCKQMNKNDGTNINTNYITSTLVHTCEGLKNAQYGTKTGHGYYGTCLPKDSSELSGLESEYGLTSRMFKEVVRVNDEVVANDDEEVLHGDFHKPCSDMIQPPFKTTTKISSGIDLMEMVWALPWLLICLVIEKLMWE